MSESPKDLEQLVTWLDQLSRDIRRHLSSKRWKTGDAIGEIQRKLLGRPQSPMPEDNIQRILELYRDWRLGYQPDADSHPSEERVADAAPPSPTPIPPKTADPYHQLWQQIQRTRQDIEDRLAACGYQRTADGEEAVTSDYAGDPRFQASEEEDDNDEDSVGELAGARELLRGKSVFFIVERLRVSGGPSVVIHLARQLQLLGLDTSIATPYPPDHPVSGLDLMDLTSPRLYRADALIATAWQTVERLDHLAAGKQFTGRKVFFCQSDEPAWWPPERQDHPGYPGEGWHRRAQQAFRSPGYRHIIIADHLNGLVEQYGFDVVGKVRVATPRLCSLSPLPKTGPSWVVGFINRGEKAWYKGRADCLEALKLLRRRFPWLIIRAIGFDPPDDQLSRLGVDYLQEPTESQICQFYQGLDVYLSTSFIEGCPLPQQEAMWCGCPVVTTPIGVKGEFHLHRDQGACLLVEPGNVSQLVEAVASLLEDSQLWNRYRYHGLRAISSRTTAGMTDDFVIALSRALGR